MTQAPMKAFLGVKDAPKAEEGDSSSPSSDEDYAEATEEDINTLSRILGGGM